MAAKVVLLLQVLLKYDSELCEADILRLRKKLGSSHKPAMHGKRHIGFVITSYGTPKALVDRISRELDADSFENWFVFIPLRNVVSKYGGIDALATRINLAYAALQRGPSHHLQKSHIFVEERDRKSAPRKMRVDGRDG